MSTEHDRYQATCDTCGHEGVCIRSSDDWSRSRTNWEGFDTKPVDQQAILRKRANPGDTFPTCPECGATAISVGAHIETL